MEFSSWFQLPSKPVYVIAEISANHGNQFERTVELIKAIASAGADAVKLQTFTADTITLNSDKNWFRIDGGTLWDGRILHSLYEEAAMPWEWQPKLIEIARDLGMGCFSSPFDSSAVDFLESVNVDAYKVASFELIDHGLLRRVAETRRPTILSTGMATLSEIDEAVSVLRSHGCGQLALLRTNSGYPAPAEEMDLLSIPFMADRYDVPIGLSDHTTTNTAATVATALGAVIVEKHVTLRRSDGGPDAAFSLEPAELTAFIREIRQTSLSLGQVRFGPSSGEEKSLRFRRSLFAVDRIKSGEVIQEHQVRSIRPSNGLPPKDLSRVVGSIARVEIEPGTPLSWDLLEEPTRHAEGTKR
jgi:pseudaminic acid synthase